jgi:hypothetical protein
MILQIQAELLPASSPALHMQIAQRQRNPSPAGIIGGQNINRIEESPSWKQNA